MRKTVIPDWFKHALEIDSKQVGFSKTMIEFNRYFSYEKHCLAYLAALKYPGGFVCPSCGSERYGFIHSRTLIRCKDCAYEESPTKGKLKGFPRQKQGPWDLLFLVLQDAVGKRNVGSKNG